MGRVYGADSKISKKRIIIRGRPLYSVSLIYDERGI